MRIRIKKFGPLSPLATGRRRLPFPAVPKLRAAQLTARHLFDGLAAFPPELWRDLHKYQPQVLAGPAAELQSLAEHVTRCGIEFDSLDRAVFVVTPYGGMPARDMLRVMLWQTFGVPVFEVYIASDGSILATECEAHDGWHIEPRVNFSLYHGELMLHAPNSPCLPTGIAGELTDTTCACGRPGPRVTGLQEHRYSHYHRRLLAATA